MKIAMLGHKRIPSREGGIEIVVEELAVRMARLGHEVTCYNRRGHHVGGKAYDAHKLTEYRGVRIRDVFTIDRRGLAAMTASIAGAVRAALSSCDVVHFHAEGPCAMLWLPKWFGKTCVATIHGLDHRRAKWGRFASWYIHRGEKTAVRYADQIIVLSQGVQRYFQETYGRETVWIPNGVSPAEHRPAAEITQRFGLTPDSYILFVGRMVPEKGLRILIDAFRQVHTDKKLVLAGGASDSHGFFEEMQARAADDDRILFTGFLQSPPLDELYSNAFLYVLPSDLEGMPLSLLEALSHGNACLVSDIEECADVVENHALLFRAGDADDLRAKLQDACDRPEQLAPLRAEAAAFATRKYAWNEVVRKTLECYQTGRPATPEK